MKVELNIALGTDESTDLHARRLKLSLALGRLADANQLVDIEHRVEPKTYRDPHGAEVTEYTLVVKCWARMSSLTVADRIVDRVACAISLDLEEDCVAVRTTSPAGVITGRLVGPQAYRWGPFNPNWFFTLP